MVGGAIKPYVEHCTLYKAHFSCYILFQIKYVYDGTLAVHPDDGCKATFSNILMGKPTVGDLYLRRYRTVDIPKANDYEIENFLLQVYIKCMFCYM